MTSLPHDALFTVAVTSLPHDALFTVAVAAQQNAGCAANFLGKTQGSAGAMSGLAQAHPRDRGHRPPAGQHAPDHHR